MGNKNCTCKQKKDETDTDEIISSNQTQTKNLQSDEYSNTNKDPNSTRANLQENNSNNLENNNLEIIKEKSISEDGTDAKIFNKIQKGTSSESDDNCNSSNDEDDNHNNKHRANRNKIKIDVNEDNKLTESPNKRTLNSNLLTLCGSGFINNINNLNEVFVDNNMQNTILNNNWKKLSVENFVPNQKIYSPNIDEIMYKGSLNKLVLAFVYKNCSLNINKFCMISKENFSIYNNKESFVLMAKPQHKFKLSDIRYCKRIDLTSLNIKKLKGLFFMCIELKIYNEKFASLKNDDNLVINLIKKENINKFFIFFANKEKIIDEWVSIINYFMNNYNNNKDCGTN